MGGVGHDIRHWCEIATHASVHEVLEDLDTCQLILIPERAIGARHWEDVPLVGSTGRLAHVEILAVVGVSRESGSALCQVVAQGTLLYLKYRHRLRNRNSHMRKFM